MKTALLTTIAPLVLLSAASLTVAEEPSTVTQVEMVSLKIRICEATADGKPKVLAEPTIMTITGREIRFVSGGEMKSRFDDSTHDIGTQVVATIDAVGERKYRLRFEASLGNATLPEQEPDTECFIQQKLTARTIVELGKMKKIHVSPERWYEITVGDPKLMHFDFGNGLVPMPTTQVGTALSGTVRYEELPAAPMGVAKPSSSIE